MSEHENSIDIDGLCCTECFYQGRIAERERIIALLEESMAVCVKNQHEVGCDACYGQRDAIALIKGEK